MTIRETAIAKLQRLPESLLQQVSDFIDFLVSRQQPNTVIVEPIDDLTGTWTRWFESVDCIEAASTSSTTNYQQHLLVKYQQQGLEL